MPRGTTTPRRPDRHGGHRAAPPCIALTGGIGAGKSEALAAFAACGAATLSSDAVVHATYADPEVVAAVRARFGDDVLDREGAVDRAVLGPRAFAEDGGLAFLEALVHPRVGAARRAWIAAERARTRPPSLLVCEVPVLFEAGLAGEFDAVLVVTAPEPLRRARVVARGHDFDQRSGRQLPEADKVARADHAYVNDGDLAGLRAWVADRYGEYSGRACDAPIARH